MDWEDDSPLSKITQHILETLKEIRRIHALPMTDSNAELLVSGWKFLLPTLEGLLDIGDSYAEDASASEYESQRAALVPYLSGIVNATNVTEVTSKTDELFDIVTALHTAIAQLMKDYVPPWKKPLQLSNAEKQKRKMMGEAAFEANSADYEEWDRIDAAAKLRNTERVKTLPPIRPQDRGSGAAVGWNNRVYTNRGAEWDRREAASEAAFAAKSAAYDEEGEEGEEGERIDAATEPLQHTNRTSGTAGVNGGRRKSKKRTSKKRTSKKRTSKKRKSKKRKSKKRRSKKRRSYYF